MHACVRGVTRERDTLRCGGYMRWRVCVSAATSLGSVSERFLWLSTQWQICAPAAAVPGALASSQRKRPWRKQRSPPWPRQRLRGVALEGSPFDTYAMTPCVYRLCLCRTPSCHGCRMPGCCWMPASLLCVCTCACALGTARAVAGVTAAAGGGLQAGPPYVDASLTGVLAHDLCFSF